ncbi:MAG: Nif3-like dinuclear metal center hexameric protein [Bacteroidota bacterium]|jgi:dinuclear metal center YbgI/SA1388 family protein
MVIREIQQILESWAPEEIAWEQDNVGLQIGSPDRRVRAILVALDVTRDVVNEARRKKIDLLISHHPLFLRPLRSVRDDDRTGHLVIELARHDIALYSAHTNLDFVRTGVSAALAERLGLVNLRVLSRQSNLYKKVAVFVPVQHAEKVMRAMAGAGAGHIGNYEACSFQTEGRGTFRGMKGATPYVGKRGVLERVPEIRLEMLVPVWNLSGVLAAMRTVHPYEEVAYDVYNLANASQDYGAGIIGDVRPAVTLRMFLRRIRRTLHVPALRYTGNLQRKVKRVAVCGGSGSDLMPRALQEGADAFVTADMRYHTFGEAEGAIALIDAGHFETEVPVVRRVADYLKNEIAQRNQTVHVFVSQQSRNPVQYYFS